MFILMYPTRIIFGRGTLEQLGSEVKCWGEKALLVTGKLAIRKSGILDKIAVAMELASIEFSLFDRVEHDPSLKTVDQGVKFLQEEKCDIVVGLGGGSALDTAKAIASLARQPGTVWEYYGGKEVKKEGLPFIALPTTAGTGAEITNNSVLTDRNKVIKKSIRTPFMIAKVALIDPELTLSLPAQITAYTGMDAFTQALESYVSKTSNPVSDSLALRAIEIIYSSLPEAVRNGGNIEARERMALGSLLSGMAFSNSGLGAVHGLAHPIGARFNVPHGLACAVLLPYVIDFNLRAKYDKFKQIAEKMGIRKAEEIPSAIKKLLEKVNLPLDFKSYRITEADFPDIIAQSRSNSMSKNPREVSDNDLRGILRWVV